MLPCCFHIQVSKIECYFCRPQFWDLLQWLERRIGYWIGGHSLLKNIAFFHFLGMVLPGMYWHINRYSGDRKFTLGSFYILNSKLQAWHRIFVLILFLIVFWHYLLCRIQPVYVVDVAAAIVAALKDDGTSMGKVYELGGPEILTQHELVISPCF